MWACLQDHDTANHWKQVAGWRKVCDLAQTHLGRLQEYRRGLAEAWPPETSAASVTYLAELDELIAKVRHTHDAAAANYTALSAATQAIGTTRAELRKVYEEYAGKLQRKQAFEAMAADPKVIMGNRVTESPVTDGELERLNVQARAMMFNLSGELQQAQATLQKPPAPRSPIQSGDPDALGPTAIAPAIPPIVAIPMPTVGRSVASRFTAAEVAVPMPQAQGVGPVLGSAGAGLASGPVGMNTAGSPLPTPTGPQLGPALPPSSPAQSRVVGPSSSIVRPPGGSASRPQATSPTPPPRLMPPSGLIGGPLGPGLGPSSPSASQPRKVNPIGGVIGGGGGAAGTGPSGGAGSRPGGGRASGSLPGGLAPIGGAPSLGSGGIAPPTRRHDRQQRDSDEARLWNPDSPWETDQGVNPVLRQQDEQGPIDPGPAIGFNR